MESIDPIQPLLDEEKKLQNFVNLMRRRLEIDQSYIAQLAKFSAEFPAAASWAPHQGLQIVAGTMHDNLQNEINSRTKATNLLKSKLEDVEVSLDNWLKNLKHSFKEWRRQSTLSDQLGSRLRSRLEQLRAWPEPKRSLFQSRKNAEATEALSKFKEESAKEEAAEAAFQYRQEVVAANQSLITFCRILRDKLWTSGLSACLEKLQAAIQCSGNQNFDLGLLLSKSYTTLTSSANEITSLGCSVVIEEKISTHLSDAKVESSLQPLTLMDYFPILYGGEPQKTIIHPIIDLCAKWSDFRTLIIEEWPKVKGLPMTLGLLEVFQWVFAIKPGPLKYDHDQLYHIYLELLSEFAVLPLTDSFDETRLYQYFLKHWYVLIAILKRSQNVLVRDLFALAKRYPDARGFIGCLILPSPINLPYYATRMIFLVFLIVCPDIRDSDNLLNYGPVEIAEIAKRVANIVQIVG